MSAADDSPTPTLRVARPSPAGEDGAPPLQLQGPPAVPRPTALAEWLRYAAEPFLVREGNALTVLRDGRATFPAMLEAITAAKRHVNLATYTFASDSTGWTFAHALSERARAGVEVNVLYDSVGSTDASEDVFAAMRSAGVNVVEYHPIRPWKPRWGWWRRDHRKILVADGEVGFAGGLNIADLYAAPEKGGSGWRDTHLRIEGPAVADLQRFFIAVWRRAGGRRLDKRRYLPRLAPAGTVPVRVVGNTLLWNRWAIRRAALAAFRAAKRSIWIANAYFVPDGTILGEIVRARARGVDVRLMLPGNSDVRVVGWASRSLYRMLLDEQVRIFEWMGPMLHAKTMVVDGVWSAVGSFNLDRWSLVNNLEVSVNAFDPAVAAELETMFEADLARCTEITLDSWMRRPASWRIREWLASWLKPWL